MYLVHLHQHSLVFVQQQLYQCGLPLFRWYKDGEQLLTSIPGYISIKDRNLRIVANEFNEGTYTCQIHRRGSVISANSWAIRLKPEHPSNNSWWWWRDGEALTLPPALSTSQKTHYLTLVSQWRTSWTRFIQKCFRWVKLKHKGCTVKT